VHLISVHCRLHFVAGRKWQKDAQGCALKTSLRSRSRFGKRDAQHTHPGCFSRFDLNNFIFCMSSNVGSDKDKGNTELAETQHSISRLELQVGFFHAP
jgi:hypothetical protein